MDLIFIGMIISAGALLLYIKVNLMKRDSTEDLPKRFHPENKKKGLALIAQTLGLEYIIKDDGSGRISGSNNNIIFDIQIVSKVSSMIELSKRVKHKLKITLLYQSPYKNFCLTTNPYNPVDSNPYMHIFSTGDSSIDEYFTMASMEVEPIALSLDSSTRMKLVEVLNKSNYFEISNKICKSEMYLTDKTTEKECLSFIEKMIQIISLFIRNINGFEMLKKAFDGESFQSVRSNILRYLHEFYPAKTKEKMLLEDALSDANLMVRVTAAELMGKNGLQLCLKDITKIISINNVELTLLINYFRENKFIEGLKELQKFLYQMNNDNLALYILSIRVTENSTLELILFDMLHNYDDFFKEIVSTLGVIGTKKSVEFLLYKRSSIVNPIRISDINSSIEKIQSRIESGEKGWVSLTQRVTEEGNISVVKKSAEKGSISLKKK